MAKVTIKAFTALCHLEKFEINGIEADEDDFVDKYDHDGENACEYGCGDMRADIIPAKKEVLDKYKIDIDEYNEIAKEVSKAVSFGSCGWCV